MISLNKIFLTGYNAYYVIRKLCKVKSKSAMRRGRLEIGQGGMKMALLDLFY